MMNLRQSDRNPSDDLTLLSRCQQGDRNACAALISKYQDRTIRLAYGVLRNWADAEDAAQEAFIRIFTQKASFRGESDFYSWLYRIVINCSIDQLRKPSRREIAYEPELELQQTSHDMPDDRLQMDSILGEMPLQLRTILILREIDELSYDEIARILEIPIGTVRSRLSAAREWFRKRYQEVMQDEM